jgi:hypothetical protein
MEPSVVFEQVVVEQEKGSVVGAHGRQRVEVIVTVYPNPFTQNEGHTIGIRRTSVGPKLTEIEQFSWKLANFHGF